MALMLRVIQLRDGSDNLSNEVERSLIVATYLMSASATPKSVLIGNTANMKLTYSAKVACEKEKAEFSTKQTNMS